MKSSKQIWAAISIALLALAVVGCSSADDAIDSATAKAIEDGLDDALESTVVPLFTFLGGFPALIGVVVSPAGGGCPDTSGWCTTGSATCSMPGSTLDFDFSDCEIVTGDGPATVDGMISATPTDPMNLTLTNVSLNDSSRMTGTGVINQNACSYDANISTDDDVFVDGIVILCEGDDFPQGDKVVVSFDGFVITITFDGSSTATAKAKEDGETIAVCDIDLDSDPLKSSCEAP